ncbi:hypothetical protein BaRGS_00011091 [Batillaria attramentaria]|uniref:Major facilitator superfamily (MFS) profile domain-containing protein n=1 Tax=Batillaria attramentaria TaxID=370345 RepID=A0ABD0LDW4_9CAEN
MGDPERHQLLQGAKPGSGQSHLEDVKDRQLNLTQKLTLVAGLLGTEASISYEQLYLVPVLQTLGMPLKLVSLTGFVSGLLGIAVLPVVGWLSDRGSSPQRRKQVGVLMSVSVMFLGLASVVLVSNLHLRSLALVDGPSNSSSVPRNTSRFTAMEVLSCDGNRTTNLSSLKEISDGVHMFDRQSMNTTNGADSGLNIPDGERSGLPFTAGFAMLGYIVYECGYDNANSFTRAWILSCSPRSEHTSLLVLGLVMAAVGGISTAALGRVDFPALFKLDTAYRTSFPRLVIQISIQGAVMSVLLLTGSVSSLLAGRNLMKNITTNHIISNTGTDTISTSLIKQPSASDEEGGRDNREECQQAIKDGDKEARPKSKLLSISTSADVSMVQTRGDVFSCVKTNYVTCCKTEEHCRGMSTKSSDSNQHEELHGNIPSSPRNSKRRFLRTVVCICISMLFATGTSNMFVYMISDYVGKAVFGGDPWADVDSDDMVHYLSGVRTAAWGILVYMVSYLLINLMHTRILSFLGHKVEFVVVQLVTGGSMVLLAVTARLELFFLLCVVAGLHRSCRFVVPFAAMNAVVESKTDSRGGARVGLGMSVVTAMVPPGFLRPVLLDWGADRTNGTCVHSTVDGGHLLLSGGRQFSVRVGLELFGFALGYLVYGIPM